jgi:SAM-dependent methyltransferase
MDQPLSDVEEYIQFGTPPGTQEECTFLQNLIHTDGKADANLLDLACGIGRHAIAMAELGFKVTGIDLSEDRVGYARNEAQKRGLRNCQFMVADLRELRLESKYNYAYCLFNTFSLFTKNEDVIRILQNIKACLHEDASFIVHLYSLWSFIAEGTFHNQTYERKDERGSLLRKEKGVEIIGRINNVYQHNRTIQYVKDGKEYAPKDEKMTQRIYSINEWDLLGRMTGFKIQEMYTRMDKTAKTSSPDVFDETAKDHEMVLVMKPATFQQGRT